MPMNKKTALIFLFCLLIAPSRAQTLSGPNSSGISTVPACSTLGCTFLGQVNNLSGLSVGTLNLSPPLSGTFYGGLVPAKFWINLLSTSSSASTPEIGQQIYMTSAIGGAGGAGVYKVADAAITVGTAPGHAYLYGHNDVVQGFANTVGSGGLYGAEMDVNNFGADATTTIGVGTGAYGVQVLTGGSKLSTVGYRVASALSQAAYRYGFDCDANLANDCFTDLSNSIHVLTASNAHTAGIDFTGATFSSNVAFAMANTHVIVEKDVGGTLRNLAYIDGSSNATFGDQNINSILYGANITISSPAHNVFMPGLPNAPTTSAVCYNIVSNLISYGGTIGTCNTSDARLKNVEGDISNALEKLLRIHGIYFHWKDPIQYGEGRNIGVTAQNVETVFPELVSTGSDGLKSVAYEKLVAPIIEAMRELKGENDKLRACQASWKCRLLGIN